MDLAQIRHKWGCSGGMPPAHIASLCGSGAIRGQARFDCADLALAGDEALPIGYRFELTGPVATHRKRIHTTIRRCRIDWWCVRRAAERRRAGGPGHTSTPEAIARVRAYTLHSPNAKTRTSNLTKLAHNNKHQKPIPITKVKAQKSSQLLFSLSTSTARAGVAGMYLCTTCW